MSVLRFVSVVLLAMWVGGLAALGTIGAPAIFAVLEGQDPSGGRTLAGAVFGAVFSRFQHVAWVLGGLLLAVLGVRAALGPRPRRFGLRMWTIAGMLALSLVTTFGLTPRIDRLRETTPGTIASLPDADPRKIAFGRLHGLSTGFMLVTLVAGLGLIFAETRDTN
jgi:uncharacterized membrane protein